MSDFVPHLRLHSEYSLHQGLVRLEGDDEIGRLAAERGIAAVAITDSNNIHAALHHQQSCLRHGVKPIVGCHAQFADKAGACAATVLCESEEGYRNLCRLLSEAQLGNDGSIDLGGLAPSDLAGLIVLLGQESDVAGHLRRDKPKLAAEALARWRRLCADDALAIELTFAGRELEELISLELAKLGGALGLPAVAAHPVMFAREDDFEAHEMRVCIANAWQLDDSERPHLHNQRQHLLSAKEMAELFAAWPEALANARAVALRCNFHFDTEAKPQFAKLAGQAGDAGAALRSLVADGLKPLLAAADEPRRRLYRERADSELEVIVAKGFADYFLIVADLVRFAKDNAIPVGPGRGSGAGSLVAYTLGITGIDPLAYDLLFERFLNPERSSLPDFDIDFCKNRRDEIIEHARTSYGADCVCQVVTYNTMKAKAVVRDVCRALGKPYAVGDNLARLITDKLNITLSEARLANDGLEAYIGQEGLERAWELALALEGVVRQASTHASAVLIAPSPITSYCPLALVGDRDNANPVSQFDMKAAESIGLIKFDILGLKNLTAIRAAEQMIRARSKGFAIERIELDDRKAFKLYKQGNTVGVFQAESGGMVELIKRIDPVILEDIAVAISLFRPGALETKMDEIYLKNRRSPDQISYDHPKLERILAPTYGAMIYQEQPMLISRELAGFSLAEADTMRAAIGKKDTELMASLRQKFVDGATATLGERRAKRLFSEIEKFAGYGFNKSHAIAYALISLQTAYLKAHHPREFFAASLNTWSDDTRTTEKLLLDTAANGVTLLLPCVNRSGAEHAPTADGIRFGLSAIRGVGAAVARALVAKRPRDGYASLDELCQRQEEGELSRRIVESLVKAGACDALLAGTEPRQARAILLKQIDAALENAAASKRNVDQENLFDPAETRAALPPSCAPLSQDRLLAEEHSTLGVTLGGSFYDLMADFVRLVPHRIVALKRAAEAGERSQLWAGYVVRHIRHARLRRQGREVFILADDDASIEVRVQRGDVVGDRLGPVGSRVLVTGAVKQSNGFPPHISASSVEPLDAWAARRVRELSITCSDAASLSWLLDFLATLKEEAELAGADASCRIKIELPYYAEPGVVVDPKPRFAIPPPVIGELTSKLGRKCLRLA